nr:hypothetical protein Iba_scaffold1613721CG0010 [Ipomoea batatas]GME10450.1 hypothetical protein Iba_scaffold10073CG0650 [Ipomoea batatas]
MVVHVAVVITWVGVQVIERPRAALIIGCDYLLQLGQGRGCLCVGGHHHLHAEPSLLRPADVVVRSLFHFQCGTVRQERRVEEPVVAGGGRVMGKYGDFPCEDAAITGLKS